MPLSKSLSQYADVHRIFEAALRNSGALYRLDTPSAASYFRLRAHYYRKLLLAETARRQKNPGTAQTKFDGIKISIDKEEPCVLRFTIQGNRLEGTLYAPDGTSIDAPDISPIDALTSDPNLMDEVPDELEEFAKSLLANAERREE